MNILILGATGFIGSAVARRLAADGHVVTGLGRDIRRAQTQFAHMKWLKADLSKIAQPDDWIQLLRDQDIVVNCAGALQDGLHDDLAASQRQAMIALYAAASNARMRLIVQISASTDGAASGTAFLETKRHADEALAVSGLPYVIFRPAVVVGRNAFGGTALLRALAAIPCITPLVYADSPVMIVSLDDVAECVTKAVSGDIAANSDLHLAAPLSETVESLVRLHRSWLGLPPVRVLRIPSPLARLVGWIADRLGALGWRSPLRSTAMTVIAGGMTTERKAILPHGHEFKSVQETLSAHPAGIQDLWFARLYFAKPLLFATLSLFWLASGLIPLLDPSRASAFMEPFMSPGLAMMLTLLTCALDIGLGLAVVFRPWSRAALLGMLALSAAYLAAGTVLTPALWIDPLGPFVKVLPSMLLAVIGLAILEER